MSSDLITRFSTAIPLDTFRAEVDSVMRALLGGMKTLPSVEVGRIEAGKILPPPQFVPDPEHVIVIGLDGLEEEILLTPVTIDPAPPLVSIEESGTYVTASVGRTRKPLEYVLAASVIVVLAKYSSQLVMDDAFLWTSRAESEPDEFVDAIRLKEFSGDIGKAARAFYSSLPVSHPRGG